MNNYTYPNYNYDNHMYQNEINMPMAIEPLYSPAEGYKLGNMFPSLYSGYKNIRPQELMARTEQEKILLDYSCYQFAAHDICLYLDNYPNDMEMIKKYNEYNHQAKQLLKIYEDKYGPLTLTSNNLNTNPWAWTTTSFPWKGGL